MLGLSSPKKNKDIESSNLPEAIAISAQSINRKKIIESAVSALAILSGSAIWIYSLVKLGLAYEALPWYITLVMIAAWVAGHATRALLANEKIFIEAKYREPVSLLVSIAGSYWLSACLFFAVVIFLMASPIIEKSSQKQIVDIEFTSTADAVNHNDPLPATKQFATLRKRVADMLTQQGALSSQPSRPSDKENPKSANSIASPEENVQLQKKVVGGVKDTQTFPVNTPNSPNHLVSLVPNTQWQSSFPKVSQKHTSSIGGYLEEVQPPEMVEIMENDGDKDSTHVFQKGGHSTAGTGSKSDLALYLKELHKRIKIAWAPPKGQSRQAKILFRIKHNGKLAFIRLVESSSDTDTDEAAMRAITQSCSNHPLPESFLADYLDLLYTFTYTADELKEIPTKS